MAKEPTSITLRPTTFAARDPRDGKLVVFTEPRIRWVGKDADDYLAAMSDWHKEQHKKDLEGVSGLVSDRI
jgi:hypothetical protein